MWWMKHRCILSNEMKLMRKKKQSISWILTVYKELKLTVKIKFVNYFYLHLPYDSNFFWFGDGNGCGWWLIEFVFFKWPFNWLFQGCFLYYYLKTWQHSLHWCKYQFTPAVPFEASFLSLQDNSHINIFTWLLRHILRRWNHKSGLPHMMIEDVISSIHSRFSLLLCLTDSWLHMPFFRSHLDCSL